MNKHCRRVFAARSPYAPETTRFDFLAAMRETAQLWMDQSEVYRRIAKAADFFPKQLKSESDLVRILVLPTMYLKRNDLTVRHRPAVQVTSSGTQGKVSVVSYTAEELFMLAQMAVRLGRLHQLFSFRPTRCVILGYQPTRHNQKVISKTAALSTCFSLTISRDYALRWRNGEYQLDLKVLLTQLQKYSRGRLPVRIIGFPSYTYFLLKEMKKAASAVRFRPDLRFCLAAAGNNLRPRKSASQSFMYGLKKC